MRNSNRMHAVAAVAMVAALAGAPVAGQVAASASTESSPSRVPHLPDGRPDLNGVWEIPYTPDMSRGLEGGLPFTAWGAADFKAYDAEKFDYTGHCLPAGLTRLANTPMPMKIVQGPNNAALLFEGFSTFIVRPTNGPDHPKNLKPSASGNSIAPYE